MEWLTIKQENFTTTDILNLGHEYVLRLLIYNNDGDIINSSLIKIDRLTGDDLIKQKGD